MVDGVPDGDVSIQRDGAEVHDGGRREENVQVDPDGTKVGGKRPPVIWGEDGGMNGGREAVSYCQGLLGRTSGLMLGIPHINTPVTCINLASWRLLESTFSFEINNMDKL